MAEPRWVVVGVWIAFPLLGAAACWILQASAAWLADLRWVPKRRLFEFLASLPEVPRTAGALALGSVAGLVVALAAAERLTVTVAWDLVTLARPAKAGQQLARTDIGAVFIDDKELVLLDRVTAELAREKSDLKAAPLRDAFVSRGYPWCDKDPYEDDYRLWVPGTPGLPAGANGLLMARGRTLEGKKPAESTELRAELARLGIVVRTRGKRQYWRRSLQRP